MPVHMKNRIKNRRYHYHPCKVHGLKFTSIAQAARFFNMTVTVMRYRLLNGFRGYKLLPYDGPMPHANNVKPIKPHIYAEGRWYRSQYEAANDLAVAQCTISNRINNPNFPNYYVRLPD